MRVLHMIVALTSIEGVVQEVIQMALNRQRLKQELLVVFLARCMTHQDTLANLDKGQRDHRGLMLKMDVQQAHVQGASGYGQSSDT